jgi:hypothetical protein
MKEFRNCPNCGAPLEAEINKCPYCGTSYFDFSICQVGVDDKTPIVLKFKATGRTMEQILTALVIPSGAEITYNPIGLDSEINIHFKIIKNLTIQNIKKT